MNSGLFNILLSLGYICRSKIIVSSNVLLKVDTKNWAESSIQDFTTEVNLNQVINEYNKNIITLIMYL